MGDESSQKSIGRNRPPRVHITYDVDSDGATELKEIPFVMGVMSDLSGDASDELPEIENRKFSDVDAHTFNTFLKDQKPRLMFQVPNTLTGAGKLDVDITFDSMEDFSPAAIAAKVEGLKQILEARTELNRLLNKLGSKPKLGKVLDILLKNPELAKQYQAQIAAAGEAKS